MPKIMLLEDDRDMYFLLRTLFELEGYEVIQASGVEDLKKPDDVVRLVRQESPALLLMDVYLDQLDGFKVLRALREDPTLREMRILMSSGMDFSEKAKQEGADGFLLKPYMPDELIRQVRMILTQRSAAS